MRYIVPNKKYLKKCSKKRGKLVWEPAILLHFISDKERRVIFDAAIPDLQNTLTPSSFIRLLFARNADLFRFSFKEEFPGHRLYHIATDIGIINDIKEARELLVKLFDEEKKRFNEKMKEEAALMMEWEKFRWLLVPPEHPPLSRAFSAGRDIKHVTMMIIKDIMEVGLGLKQDTDLKLIFSERVYYPVYVTEDLIVYEPALKKETSMSYTRVLQADSALRALFLEILKK